jgi:hypothetical protein
MKTRIQVAFRAIIGLAALALALTPASAAVILLSDNFNTEGVGPAAFNDSANLIADQAGTLATKDYNLTGTGWGVGMQRGNGGMMLMYANGEYGTADMRGSVNYNFAAAANSYGQALEIKFNMSVSNGVEDSDWTSFCIGSNQNPFVTDVTSPFSTLFRDNGGTQQFADGGDVSPLTPITFADGNLITLVISDSSGTGSAFTTLSNGFNDMVKMYVGATLVNTWTNLDFGDADGYISFHAFNTVAQIDNLTLSVIPEPASLGMFGAAAVAMLLRRRFRR